MVLIVKNFRLQSREKKMAFAGRINEVSFSKGGLKSIDVSNVNSNSVRKKVQAARNRSQTIRRSPATG